MLADVDNSRFVNIEIPRSYEVSVLLEKRTVLCSELSVYRIGGNFLFIREYIPCTSCIKLLFQIRGIGKY